MRAATAARAACVAQSKENNVSKEKPDDLMDIERLRHWMEAVGGNIFLGLSTLKSLEESKDGDKLTIVLKKKKQKANTDEP